MYSFKVFVVLISMIISGAGRSVAVKLFYQLGFENPLFVTLLYLCGQALSLVVYYLSRRWDTNDTSPKWIEISKEESIVTSDGDLTDSSVISSSSSSSSITSLAVITGEESAMDDERTALENPKMKGTREKFVDELEINTDGACVPRSPLKRQGSDTGLTAESKKAVMWVHSIPWYLKPAIPGFFNLCNSAMRWGSLMFVSASIAEMLISGLELVFSVVAARIVRKRLISHARWKGVVIVTVGLLLVRFAKSVGKNVHEEVDDGNEPTIRNDDVLISTSLIIGQCVMSVCQDMAEELFMQETEFPATLLLGMEGVFGLIFGVPLYFLLAPYFGETPSDTWNIIISSSFKAQYIVALTCGFTVTGIFNIVATNVTSSMTRNVWKNFRTLLVWLIGLLLFYRTGDADLGEAWVNPNSLYALFGYLVMLSGVWIYYGR